MKTQDRALKDATRRALIRRRSSLSAALLACLALALALPSFAAARQRPPGVLTRGFSHVRGTSALLAGAINPHGSETTYYFQYGPTAPAYGAQTPTASAGSGTTSVKVGQTVSRILPGYHYRLVATNAGGTRFGADRIFGVVPTRLKFELFKPAEPPVFATPVTIAGAASGPGNANHRIALQSSPFPYTEAFTSIGLPILTGATGRFSFHVGALPQSTQFRVITLDPLPRFSPILTERVAVRVTLKMRSSGRPGFVRLYGTVTPAEVGARVEFQLQKAVRPGGRTERSEERTTAFVTQHSTVVKKATRTVSRFSSVVNVRHAGRYRAFVVLRAGPLVSGASPTLFLRAATKKTHAKR